MNERHQWRSRVTAAILFIGLFGMVFLGDGKQALVDMAGAVVVLMVVGAHALLHRKRQLPTQIHGAWILFLAYEAVRLFGSDDIAYSVYTVFRYVDAYLLFYVFYCYSDHQSVRFFVKLLLLFCGTVTALSLLWGLAPALWEYIPPMNLLTISAGHNHVVDIIMFGLPAATVLALSERRLPHLMLLGVFYGGAAAAFSRAAGALFVLFSAAAAMWYTLRSRRSALVGVAAVSAGVVIYLLANGTFAVTGPWGLHIGKSGYMYSGRLGYWTQALEAIRERSVFGSGPGTYALRSLRLQRSPGESSWFAHSLFLETVVESGIPGAVFFLALVAFVIKAAGDAYSSRSAGAGLRALAAGAVMTLAYSFIEFNMNFLVVWMLFFSALGAVAGAQSTHGPNPDVLRRVPQVAVGLLTLFYLSFFAGLAALASGNPALSLLLAPYQNVQSLAPPAEPAWPSLQPQAVLIERMSPNRSGVQGMIAEAYAASGRYDQALDHYRRAVGQDPQNVQIIRDQLILMETTGQITGMRTFLETYAPQGPRADSTKALDARIPDAALERAEVKTMLGEDASADPKTLAAKLYYVLGFVMMDTRPSVTEDLWKASQALLPEWGHFYVELAALLQHKLNDASGARSVLTACMRVYTAATECAAAARNIPPPGGLLRAIQDIPKPAAP